MALKFPVSIIVSALDKASGPLRNVESRLTQWGRRLQKVGSTMSTYVTTPLMGLGAASIYTGLGFEKSMKRIGLFSGATESQLDLFREQIEALGMQGPHGVTKLAEAMAIMADETRDIGRVSASMAPTSWIATLLDVDPKEAAVKLEAISDLEPDFRRIADVIADVGVKQPGSIVNFVDALESVVPRAKAAGVSFEATAELMATLTGLAEWSPTQAASGIGMFLSTLSKSDAQAALADLPGWLAQLRTEEVKGSDIAEKFGKRNALMIRTLLDADPDKIRELQDAIGGPGGSAERGAGKLTSELDLLKAAFQGLLVEAAESGLLATFVDVLKDLRGVLQWFAKLDPGTKKGIVYGLMSAAGIGPGLSAAGGAMGWLGFLGKKIPALGGLLSAGSGVGLLGAGAVGATMLLSGDSPAAAQSTGQQGLIEGFGSYFRSIWRNMRGEQKPVEISVVNAPPGTRVMSTYDENGVENFVLDMGGTMKD